MEESPLLEKKNWTSRVRRGLRMAAIVLLWLAFSFAWLWSLGALWFFRALPPAAGVSLALLWTLLTVLLFVKLPKAISTASVGAGVFLVWAVWSLQQPAQDRDWLPNQARMPDITFDGDLVTIDNFRYATYQTEEVYDVAWLQRTYDLRELEGVDFIVVPFSKWRGLAHTFLSFRFADDNYVAVSVEIRRSRGQEFSPLRGLFRNYELIYVIGDERDLLALRTNILPHPVYCYPIKAEAHQVRAVFVSMLERAERLRQQPEFYNTLTNACSTNLLWHLNKARREPVPWQWRVMLPGYSDKLVFDLGLIDFDGTLEEARRRFHLQPRDIADLDSEAWSCQVRGN